MIANFNHGVSCLQTTKNKFYNLCLIDYSLACRAMTSVILEVNIVSIKEFDFSRQTLVRKIELR